MQRCKGCRDLLPQDMLAFRHIEGVFRSHCLKWGYEEVRTPTLERLHLFTSVGTLTPSMLGKVYSFLDWDGWSGERVVLRPEGTIPTARLYVEGLNNESVAKLYYVENVFSFEESGTQSGERWQCGTEFIGNAGPAVDVELVLLALEILGDLGFKDVGVYVSHAGLLRALLQESGLSVVEQNETLDRILDGDMELLEKVVEAYPQHSKEALPLLFELSGKSAGFLKNLRSSLVPALPGIKSGLEDFIGIAELLDSAGIQYQIDIKSGKGFEYYTGVIFQFYSQGQKLGGGGRYNDLVPLLEGGNVPASGFALYIDQLMKSIPSGKVGRDNVPRILVVNDNKAEWGLSLEAANLLRRADYVAELDQGSRGARVHRWVLKVSSKDGAPHFILRDQLKDKRSRASSMDDILKVLQEASAAETSFT